MKTDLVRKHYNRFQEQSITMNPYVLHKLGLKRNKSLIKIMGYQLFCVPYMLSLHHAKILIILNSKERQIFGDLESNFKLHLEFLHPNLDRSIPLFFNFRINDLKQINSQKNQCILDIEFTSVPQDYNEILIDFFLKIEEQQALYGNPIIQSKTVKYGLLMDKGLYKHAQFHLHHNNNFHGRIIELSLNRLRVFIDQDENSLKQLNDPLIIDLKCGDVMINLDGKMTQYKPSKEVDGCFIVDVAIDFSSSLLDFLYPMITQ